MADETPLVDRFFRIGFRFVLLLIALQVALAMIRPLIPLLAVTAGLALLFSIVLRRRL